jgi:hypothetical protein
MYRCQQENLGGRRDPVPTLTHRRVRQADRTHGRGNPTALAICLKYRE